MGINQTIRNLSRLSEIIQVLIKYGFENFIGQTQLKKLIPESQQRKWKRGANKALDLNGFERIRMAAEELGPTFIKFAQVLSNRPDLLPDELISEFQKLQDQVPPFKLAQAKKIIELETKHKIDELFDEFTDEPIGAASIGQVYKAKLKTGEAVAIKVQRPGIENKVKTDIEILKEIVVRGDSVFERYGIANLIDLVEAFESTMLREMDYTNEAKNIEQFSNFYREVPNLVIPKLFKEYCTTKILVQDFCAGCKISDVEQIKAWGLNPMQVAETGIDLYLSQIFEHGFFHADPHPGNVLSQPDGKICLIDYGMVGKLMKKDKFAFAGVFIAMAQNNPRGMAMNIRRLAIDDDIKDSRKFEYQLNELIEDFAHLSVAESSMAELGTRLQQIVYEHKMKMPGSIFLILRALAILEGIGKTLAPEFDVYQFIKPYGKKLITEQYSLENIAEEIYYRGTNIASLANRLPIDIKDIMRLTRKGRLSLNIEHAATESFFRTLNRLTNRIMVALIVVALIIGGSLALLADLENMPYFLGMPLITWLAYLGAGFLCTIIFANAMRGPKM